ncbi:flagellin lysine-N-methylase [Pseudomonas sp. LJDD11]|uniref:flagellin lysine-N-methylase n=1 Tax=Pseudomonas sp. LJDD11 TaxID=2931984 RepID=UPI00211BF1D8|nr:flagellin lysine-N-methylase [Pseudomonas sp. LJDD11]MCQ9422494.1 flagellin lysine-N-methylase [Pseudomonas sp. LJDD11]
MATLPVKAFQYIQSFSCLAEQCEDTCCQNWPIAVTPRWVERAGQTAPELLNLIAREHDDYRIKKNDHNQCLALQHGRCSIHAARGEPALPDICSTYPRMYRRINELTVKSATMSCPEVTRLVLFSDAPFQLEEQLEDDYRSSASSPSTFDGLDDQGWVSTVNFFNDLVLGSQRSAGDVLVQLYELVGQLNQVPYAQWGEAAAPLTRGYQLPAADPALIVTDPLLLVLFEITQAPFVPDSLRQSVMAAIDIEAGQTPQHNRVNLKPQVRELAYSAAGAALEPVLKRFMAAEMTRTGFPFISTTSAGQDYGVTLVEWAATLAIRTLALRYLLLVQAAAALPEAPDQQQIVDRVYRYCRAASHNGATVSEKVLRQAISQQGAPYLLALVRQTQQALH